MDELHTVLTRRFGGNYLAEGSANCAAKNENLFTNMYYNAISLGTR